MNVIAGTSTTDGLPFNAVYDTDAVGNPDTELISPRYFKWDRWSSADNSFQFSPMEFDELHMPLGDSNRYCLDLEHANIKDRYHYDKYNKI